MRTRHGEAGQVVSRVAAVLLVAVVSRGVMDDEDRLGLYEGVFAAGFGLWVDVDASALLVHPGRHRDIRTDVQRADDASAGGEDPLQARRTMFTWLKPTHFCKNPICSAQSQLSLLGDPTISPIKVNLI